MNDALALPPQRQVPQKRAYRHLFTAQALALVSTGIATVALALLAYNLAGPDAGAVLGTALAIKMLAYVGVAPVAAAFAERLPRRAALIALDLVRAVVALAFPFVTKVWEVYVLIFIFQAASAAFAPIYQAAIPDLLPDEEDYAYALSRSRLAYELEGVISPILAAALLLVVSFPGLFAVTVFGFLVSAGLILRIVLPRPAHPPRGDIRDRMTLGFRVFLAAPSLRGLLALNLVAATATAMVVVNTVVLVQVSFGLSERATALAMVAFGVGAVCGAVALPRLPDSIPDRTIMLSGGVLIAAALILGVFLPGYATLLLLWVLLGLGASLAQTPAGHLLCANSRPEDRQTVYAAQFALSNACLLMTYPLAGWVGAAAGMPAAFVLFGLVAGAGVLAGAFVWPRGDRAATAGDDRSSAREPMAWDARL